MEFVNTTPHKIVLYKDGKVWKEFPKSDEHQLRMTSAKVEEHQLEGFPVVSAPKFVDVDGAMPSGAILVSMPVGQFLADKRKNVYGPDTGPDGVVRNDAGQIIGTKRLVKYSTV